jgi:FMN phosphatase YigB (HAD superfamily)
MTATGLKALLLDLDDTLLGNSMDTFIPAYFGALKDFVSHLVPGEEFIAHLLSATRLMTTNDGSGPTNEEVFSEAFYPSFDVERRELEPVLEAFYREAFPKLQPLTQPRTAAPLIIEWAQERGLQVVIATNPLFPRTAIEQRMAWGGVGVDRFAYDRVTTYENSRATKSHPAYYLEILSALGRQPGECVMVGDNWGWDVEQAAGTGIPGYWIAGGGERSPNGAIPFLAQGSLDDFLETAKSGRLDELLNRLVDGGAER